jgi:hypothetical protein
MAVNVCLPLYGDPGRELGDGPLRPQQLRTLGDELRERLSQAAETLEKLAADGWSAQAVAYDALLTHSAVQTREEAEARLRALGIDPAGLMIVEELDDEEAG